MLNPANILNLYSTLSGFKDILSINSEALVINTEKFLENAKGQPIYSHFVNEIVSNYLDILINYATNLDQLFIKTHVNLLYKLQQTHIDSSISYIKEGDGFHYFKNNVYCLILAMID